jgi:nucleoside-diphosphate-sugar epimerase
LNFEGDYWPDFHIPDEAPLHTGSDLYALTKCLGGEIVRTFAERHDLEVIVFLYCGFGPAAGNRERPVYPMQIAWEDTGEPFACALRADRMPHNYEVFDIMADLPHGKWSSAKAQRLLGWKPKHNFEESYTRRRT